MSLRSNRKTWNREVAALLLGFLCYLAYVGSVAELEILTWPFMIFSMAAFGFKQHVVQEFVEKGANRK